MKHTTKLLTLAALITAVITLTGCPGPVNNYVEPAHEHVFGEWVVTKEATCTETGLKERTCACGEIEEEVIPALGHDMGDWSDWTVTVAATTTTVGKKVRTRSCKRTGCNHSETETETIPVIEDTNNNSDDNNTDNTSTEEENSSEDNSNTEETQHVHNYVGGGCDDINCTEHYQYDDYQISAYIYKVINGELKKIDTLYFSFDHNNLTSPVEMLSYFGNPEQPYIEISNLIHMKVLYENAEVDKFRYDSDIDYITASVLDPLALEELSNGSPIHIVIE